MTAYASTKGAEVEDMTRSRRGQAALPPEAIASYGNSKPFMKLDLS